MSGPILRFYPYLRTGLARHIAGTGGSGIPSAATIAASVTVNGKPIPRTLTLRGPGHVVGIEANEILRVEPADGATNFEPNYFPHVELASADLPWRFTPLAPNGQSLRPWLVLVVVRRRPGISITARPGGLLPVLEITAEADARTELPDLARSASWAFVQHTVDANDAAAAVEQQFVADPSRFVARLICPRKLAPNTSYIAALVPAFDAGKNAGLGASGHDPATLQDAWTPSSSSATLPIYHHWSFSTGPAGDFEALVRALDPTVLGSDIGYRTLDLCEPGSGITVMQARGVAFEGALVAPASQGWWKPLPSKASFQQQLRGEVNRSATHQEVENDSNVANDPVVGPPIYGGMQTRIETLDAKSPVWLTTLNDNPHWRAVAGLGAAVVRRNQEALVAGAWDQAGDQRAANTVVRQARLGAAVGERLAQRLKKLSSGALLQLTRGMHGRVRAKAGDVNGNTIHQDIATSNVPKGMVSAAFRRMARPSATPAKVVRTASHGVAPSATLFTRQVIAGKIGFAQLRTIEVPQGIILDTGSCYGSQQSSSSEQTLAASLGSSASARSRTMLVGTIAKSVGADGPISATQQLALEGTRKRMLDAAGPNTATTVLGQAATVVSAALQPNRTITRRVAGRITGLGLAADAPLPDRTQVIPSFNEPLYEDLLALGAEFLCPGIGSVGNDVVGLLEINAEFVVSFLIGANHELGRELMWREFPCPSDATFLQHFWDAGVQDIGTISAKSSDPRSLAQLATAQYEGSLVLLVRGQLLRRYPDLVVYAVEATGTSNQPVPNPAKPHEPKFRGTVDASTQFWAFDVNKATARGDGGGTGWFFVIEQQPTAARFGLDQGTGTPIAMVPANTNDWSWDHVKLEANGAHANLGAAPFAGMSAADVARATYQRPVRFFAHARTMLPA